MIEHKQKMLLNFRNKNSSINEQLKLNKTVGNNCSPSSMSIENKLFRHSKKENLKQNILEEPY